MIAELSSNFGALVSVYKLFCDATFPGLGEESESENALLLFGFVFLPFVACFSKRVYC